MNVTDKFSVKVLRANQWANIITRCHTCPDAISVIDVVRVETHSQLVKNFIVLLFKAIPI